MAGGIQADGFDPFGEFGYRQYDLFPRLVQCRVPIRSIPEIGFYLTDKSNKYII